MGAAQQTMQLDRLLEGMPCLCSSDAQSVTITAITADSRQAGPGLLFVALPGLTVDGHQFVQDALARGCAAVVVNSSFKATTSRAVIIKVDDTRQALGHLAAAFFGHPARKMSMIGLTGTNGKTTTSYLLESIVLAAGGKPGVLGTVNYRIGESVLPAALTTPEPLVLQRLLREMVEAGATHAIMEVSSHALAQERLSGLKFDLAIFTNLSRDHLDFHGSMQEYYACKKRLFTEYLKEDGRSIIVLGSAGNDWSGKLVSELLEWPGLSAEQKSQGLITCGIQEGRIRTGQFSQSLQGIIARIETPAGALNIHSGLVGEFNMRNMLAAVAGGFALGIELRAIEYGINTLQGVPGRLERVPVQPGVQVFVDYAHTPDALLNVLQTLRNLNPQRLIVVFGCGGERDRGKRPLMGEVAGRLADLVLVTTDNPRRESAAAILAEIEAGLVSLSVPRMRAAAMFRQNCRAYDVIPSRREAIGLAVRLAKVGDVILISGKGHEDYQITSHGRHFFDDRLEVAREMAKISC